MRILCNLSRILVYLQSRSTFCNLRISTSVHSVCILLGQKRNLKTSVSLTYHPEVAINFYDFWYYKLNCTSAGIFQLFETICYRNLHDFNKTRASNLLWHQLALKKKTKPTTSSEFVSFVWFLEINIQCFGMLLEITGSYSPFYLTNEYIPPSCSVH